MQIRGSEQMMADQSDFPSLDQVRSQLRRPGSLTCLAWSLIAFGACAAVDLALHDPARWAIVVGIGAPAWFPYALYATAPVYVACGVGFLQGWEWARLLWLGFCVAQAALVGFVIPLTLPVFMGAVASIAAFAFLLFRPAANDYFVAISSQNDPRLR